MIAVGGLTYFVINMLVPLLQTRAELRDDEVFASRFFGYGSDQTMEVDLAEPTSDNDTELARVEQALQSCNQALINLTYKKDGRMMIAIDDERSGDGQCSMAIRAYSAVVRELDCTIPTDKLASWNAWKSPEGPETTEIDGYCKVIRSFKVADVELPK